MGKPIFQHWMFGCEEFRDMKWWKPLFGRQKGQEGSIIKKIRPFYKHGELLTDWQGIIGKEGYAGGNLYYKEDFKIIQGLNKKIPKLNLKKPGEAAIYVPKIMISLIRKGLLIGFRDERYPLQKEWIYSSWSQIDKNVRTMFKKYTYTKGYYIVWGLILPKKIVLGLQEKIENIIILVLKVMNPIFEEWRNHWRENVLWSQLKKSSPNNRKISQRR